MGTFLWCGIATIGTGHEIKELDCNHCWDRWVCDCNRTRPWAARRFKGDRTRGNGFKLKEGWFSLDVRGKWGAGTGCPERLWMPCPWRCSRPGWMRPLAAWSGIRYGGWWPCLWQGSWNLMILPTQAILWFYDSLEIGPACCRELG